MPDHSHAIKGQYVVVDSKVRIGRGSSIWNHVYIGKGCEIGEGVTLASHVHIAPGAKIGDRTLVQASAVVGHVAEIGKDCFIGPAVLINADPFPPIRRATGVEAWDPVVIEDGAIIGAGAIIQAGVRIGRRAVVGMGALVVADIPEEMVAIGTPARPIYKRSEYDRRQQEFADSWKIRNQ